jgi:hypothetical protein
MTTSTDIDLRHYIIGVWILESYERFDLDGSNVHYPLGSDARGTIVYTTNGYMSAQIMRADRPQFLTLRPNSTSAEARKSLHNNASRTTCK